MPEPVGALPTSWEMAPGGPPARRRGGPPTVPGAGEAALRQQAELHPQAAVAPLGQPYGAPRVRVGPGAARDGKRASPPVVAADALHLELPASQPDVEREGDDPLVVEAEDRLDRVQAAHDAPAPRVEQRR